MINTGFFIGGIVFFTGMILTLAFTIFLYINLVIAVKNNSDVPKWIYKIGHALKGRGADTYKDFMDKSVLNEVNFYIIGLIAATTAVYFIFYDRNSTDDKIKFWIYTEFLIIIVMRIVVILGKLLLSIILNRISKIRINPESSAAANAVTGMFIMSIFACMLTITITGLPVKAPVVQVGNYKIAVGHTTAYHLISNGFTFIGKTPNDIVENKRESHFYFGETFELVKDGKGYGYVNLTPKYEDKARLEDCIVTYFGISSKSEAFDDIKICDKNISKLSLSDFKKKGMRDIFLISDINCRENSGNEHFLIKMQIYPYILWKRYTIETTFFTNDNSNQFEVYAQHILWE